MMVIQLKLSVEIKQKSYDIYIVTVSDKVTTRHNVKSTERMLNDLTDNRITKYSLIEFSFNINVISRYFSEYREKVKQWCDENSI